LSKTGEKPEEGRRALQLHNYFPAKKYN